MSNLERPSTSCQIQRPCLANDDEQNPPSTPHHSKPQLSRSYTFDGDQMKHYRNQMQNKITRPTPMNNTDQISSGSGTTTRVGRSLLSNDNWRQETMGDVRLNAKTIEQSDQNILFGKGEKRNNERKSRF